MNQNLANDRSTEWHYVEGVWGFCGNWGNAPKIFLLLLTEKILRYLTNCVYFILSGSMFVIDDRKNIVKFKMTPEYIQKWINHRLHVKIMLVFMRIKLL